MKTPHDFIKEAGDIINQRGTDNGYDKGQERSAAQIAAVFNALARRDLTEHEVWLLQICVKLVRNQSKRRDDNIVDLIGYAALMGESQHVPLAAEFHADTTPQQVETLALTQPQVKPVTAPAEGVARRALEAAKQEAKSDSPVGDTLLSGVALEVAEGTQLNCWAHTLHTERLRGETDQSLRARLVEIRKMQQKSRPRTPGRFA